MQNQSHMTYKQCQALTQHVQPCQNGAMPNSHYCGPHQNYNPQKPPHPPQPCKAKTTKNKPCPAKATPTSDYCTYHTQTITGLEQTNLTLW